MAGILQGQIKAKSKLETTETQTKIVEQEKNGTQPPTRVEQQVVIISESPTPHIICKSKAIKTTPPHQISF